MALSIFGRDLMKPLSLSRYAMLAAALGVLVAAVAWANHREARRLQEELDALDRG